MRKLRIEHVGRPDHSAGVVFGGKHKRLPVRPRNELACREALTPRELGYVGILFPSCAHHFRAKATIERAAPRREGGGVSNRLGEHRLERLAISRPPVDKFPPEESNALLAVVCEKTTRRIAIAEGASKMNPSPVRALPVASCRKRKLIHPSYGYITDSSHSIRRPLHLRIVVIRGPRAGDRGTDRPLFGARDENSHVGDGTRKHVKVIRHAWCHEVDFGRQSPSVGKAVNRLCGTYAAVRLRQNRKLKRPAVASAAETIGPAVRVQKNLKRLPRASPVRGVRLIKPVGGAPHAEMRLDGYKWHGGRANRRLPRKGNRSRRREHRSALSHQPFICCT